MAKQTWDQYIPNFEPLAPLSLLCAQLGVQMVGRIEFTKRLDGTGRELSIRYNIIQTTDEVIADVSMLPPDEMNHPLVLENAQLAATLWNMGRPNNVPPFPIENIQSDTIANLVASRHG